MTQLDFRVAADPLLEKGLQYRCLHRTKMLAQGGHGSHSPQAIKPRTTSLEYQTDKIPFGHRAMDVNIRKHAVAAVPQGLMLAYLPGSLAVAIAARTTGDVQKEGDFSLASQSTEAAAAEIAVRKKAPSAMAVEGEAEDLLKRMAVVNCEERLVDIVSQPSCRILVQDE